MDRGAWQATDHGVTKSWIQLKRLSIHTESSQPVSVATTYKETAHLTSITTRQVFTAFEL